MYYTCPAGDVGSTVALSRGNRHVQATVTEAFDPPRTGAENDRVRRKGESYVKLFAPLRLGSIELEPGRGALTLRARSIPGEQVMDVAASRQNGKSSVAGGVHTFLAC